MQVNVRRGAALCFAGVLAMVAIAAPASAAIEQPGTSIVVNTNLDTTADDGTCSLREAITAANTNTGSGGTAAECPAGSNGAADIITFSAATSTVFITSSLPHVQGNLIVDGGGDITVTADEGAFRPFHVDSGFTLTLKALHVGDVITPSSGGALIVDGTANLTDVTFVNTYTDSMGGAIRVNAGGTLTATRLAIRSSRGSLGGGGIYNAGTATLTDVWISGATALDTGGAAILNAAGATLTANRATFNAGHATGTNGGAVTNLGTATIANVTMGGNTAGANGGAVYNAGTISLIHATIYHNTADTGGGLYTEGGAFSTIKNIFMGGNSSTNGDPDLAGSLAGGSVGNYVGLPFGTDVTELIADALWGSTGFAPASPPVNRADNPLVDSADSATCAAAPVSGKDQRGLTRPAGACDVGAAELDKVAPTWTTQPTVSLRAGSSLVGSSSVARVSWKASDGSGTGIRQYRFQVSVDGLAYTDPFDDWDTRLAYRDVELARNHTYRFRVRAQDNDGNWSTWVAAPTFLARLVQQSAGSVDYTRTWTTTSNAVFSSGSVRYSKTAGASVSYRATGRAFAFVTTMGPTRGKARIYVNGVLKATVDLYSATSRYRVQVWTKRYSDSAARTIKVVVLGTSGRPRVDADAFVVLK